MQLTSIDLSGFTTTPVVARFLPDDNFFVVGRDAVDAPATAAIIDMSGTVLHKYGPADDVALTTRDGKLAVVTYSHDEKKPRRGAPEHHHTVKVHTVGGASKPAVRTLVADKDGNVAKLDFRIVYWTDGYTRAVGIKGGSWDAKENQRSPDTEGWYDVLSGTFSKRLTISDVVDHTVRMQVMAQHHNEPDFLAVSRDRSALHYMTPAGATPIALAEPFSHYEPSSLSYQPSRDGTMFFALEILPNNADAVARKRTDPKYMDLYEYTVGQRKATRRARFLLPEKSRGRTYSWRATGEFWIIVPRHIGFDRGGKEMRIYELKQ